MWEKEAELTFDIRCDNDHEIFGLIVKKISLYMENHSFSYLNNCQVQLDLFDMGADGIIARNYDFDGKINEPSFKFNYCFY